MPTLSFLHFTDLHLGMRDAGLWSTARQALHADLRRVTAKLGPWDVILFTGDLAFSGQRSQYETLDRELDALWALFTDIHPAAPPPLLLAVPGNHDLIRPDKDDPVAHGLLGNAQPREGLWSGKEASVAPVRKWFEGYAAWWERCKYRPRTGLCSGLLPGDFCYALNKDGASFGFVGMNSAFLDVSDDVGEGQLWMNIRQVEGPCVEDLPAWVAQRTLSFLLTHHPRNWLAPQALDHYTSVIAPPGRFASHLCGHLHEPFAEQRRVGGGEEQRIWQAASLFGLEKLPDGRMDRKHGYTAGRILIEAGGAETVLLPRLAVKRQDGSWALTADVTYCLEDDLLLTRAERLAARDATMTAPEAPRSVTETRATWGSAVHSSSLWPPSKAAGNTDRIGDRKRLVAEIVDACQRVWEAAKKALPDDPWRDDHYPVRVVGRLAALLAPGRASLEETALLLVAPFIREAILAAGATWMAGASPFDVADTNASVEPRNTLEQIHRSRPDLLRRVEVLEGDEKASVCLWLMGRAVQHSPHLWGRTRVQEVRGFVEQLERIIQASGDAAWLDIETLLRLSRSVGAAPDAFEGEDGVRRPEMIERGGVHLHDAAMAHLLCAAGWQALDIRAADDLVVDHVGRDSELTPAHLRDALQTATWSSEGAGRHVLHQECAHPVVDFALRDLVERAEAVLERVRHRRDQDETGAYGLLSGLPSRISSEITAARDDAGRARYRLPHVRFRLDHNKIRELLIGEEIYRDPALALRELYQNALDACRYRRARTEYLRRRGDIADPYEGRVVFRQGTDEAGRPYIECEDNGVGMTPSILEHVFSVAGRRFHDMPDFLEERAVWQRCSPPIELYPNSQFGIGVLSYFMLADELTVQTRRYEADGSLGRPILVHISSASGLFRLEEARAEDVPDAGTRVRLYLAKTEYEDDSGRPRPVSCGEILGNLLILAEFDTTVYNDGERTLRWPPGVPTDRGREAPPWMYAPTRDPDVFWVGRRVRGEEGSSRGVAGVLADGIATDEDEEECLLVNLRGHRYPKLSVDRKQILRWDDAWLHDVMLNSAPDLIGWEGLTLEYLWEIETVEPDVAHLLFTHLVARDVTLATSPYETEKFVRAREVGSFPPDDLILSDHKASLRASNPIAAWRATVWSERHPELLLESSSQQSDLVNRLTAIVPEPGDAEILLREVMRPGEDFASSAMRFRGLWEKGLVIRALDVLIAARRQRRHVRDVIARVEAYAHLGFEADLGSMSVEALQDFKIDKPLWRSSLGLARINTHAVENWATGEIKIPLHVTFSISDLMRSNPREVYEVFTELVPLGVRVAPIDSVLLEALGALRANLDTLLTDRRGRWPSGPISTAHILLKAKQAGLRPSEVASRLIPFAPLGLTLGLVDPSALDHLVVTNESRVLLSRELDGSMPAIGPKASVQHVIAASHKLDLPVSEIARRLSELGVEVPPADLLPPDRFQITATEASLVRSYLTAQGESSELEACRAFLAAAAKEANIRSISDVIAVAKRLRIGSDGFFDALKAVGDDKLKRADIAIIEAFARVHGPDAATYERRGRALARFRLWSVPVESFDQRLKRLRPLLDELFPSTVPRPA